MSAALLLAIAGLVGVGVYLVTARSLSRIVLGFSMLGHAAVLSLLGAGGRAAQPPLADRVDDTAANPLPQALSLTAIVISFGLTLFLLALARRQNELTGDDLVEDDLEDRRIADDETGTDDGDAEARPAPSETDAGDRLDDGVPVGRGVTTQEPAAS